MKDPEQVAFFVRRLPKKLRDDFKAWCTLRGMSMKDKIVELMQLTCSGHELRKTKDAIQRTATRV